MPSHPFPESIQYSLHTLGFADGVAPSSIKELNKRYHLLALKHHPDKAGVGDDEKASAIATERFKEINDAHKRVKDYFYSSDTDNNNYDTDTGYDSLLQLFIQTILVKMTSTASTGAPDASAIQSLIHMIITKGIQSGITLFRNMEKHSCITIYELLSKNQDLFGISQEMMDELSCIVEEKTGEDIVVRLNPSLLDMLLDRVYILQENGHTYYIPLWHSELHFKKAQPANESLEHEHEREHEREHEHEVIVLCDPELPDNVNIDDDNNIFISLDVDVRELFVKQIVPVYINDEIKSRGFVFYLHACDVNLTSNTRQCVLLHGIGGIARCNTQTSDIYNVGIRANVYANVRLTLEN
jgi:hypothetical protein